MSPTMRDEDDDVSAFRRFLAGDNEAFARLFDRHNHRLFVYCAKFVGDADRAEDITQALWEQVILMRREPREVQNPVGLLVRIARNMCLNSQKRERRFTPLADIPEEDHPTADERTELEEAIEAGLARLSMEHREVLVLNAYCGYRFEEIAVMLGRRPDAIWMRASRARAQLRKDVIEMLGVRHTARGSRRKRDDESNEQSETE